MSLLSRDAERRDGVPFRPFAGFGRALAATIALCSFCTICWNGSASAADTNKNESLRELRAQMKILAEQMHKLEAKMDALESVDGPTAEKADGVPVAPR